MSTITAVPEQEQSALKCTKKSKSFSRQKPLSAFSRLNTAILPIHLCFNKIGAKYYFPHQPMKYLTKSEYKLFSSYLSGNISAKDIADILLLSHRTIETHFFNIQKKLQCASKFEIPKKALLLRLIVETT